MVLSASSEFEIARDLLARNAKVVISPGVDAALFRYSLKGMRLNVYLNDNKPTTFMVGNPDDSLEIDAQKAGSAKFTSGARTFVIEWDNTKRLSPNVTVVVSRLD